MNTILDILLLALAVFAVWKLRQTFGRRTGFERNQKTMPAEALLKHAKEAQPQQAELKVEKSTKVIDEITEAAREAMQAIGEKDKNFSSKDFFKGARIAYKMIVEAFAKGDMEALKNLVRKNVAERFQAEIERRNHNHHSTKTKVKMIVAARIIKAISPVSDEDETQIMIEMESKQIAWTEDEEGRIIAGDPNTPRDMKDIWTFAKKLNSPNPNWFLVATGK
jgi:predicted lipid-binding transport protein (Tim44 family)